VSSSQSLTEFVGPDETTLADLHKTSGCLQDDLPGDRRLEDMVRAIGIS
jgi:hypothetical protein